MGISISKYLYVNSINSTIATKNRKLSQTRTVMKTTIALIFILNLIMTGISGQSSDTIRKTRYGVELSQFITGSGFASGSEIYVTILPDNRKSLSFGMYFCPEQKKISGITMHHEVALVRYPFEKRVTPYLFYNMIYRFTRTGSVNAREEGGVEYGLYKSLEHHIGLGLNTTITKDLCIKGALGYGVYFGSIMKPIAADITGEITGSNGFGAIAKIGVSYVF